MLKIKIQLLYFRKFAYSKSGPSKERFPKQIFAITSFSESEKKQLMKTETWTLLVPRRAAL
jgi:hypothetical protein